MAERVEGLITVVAPEIRGCGMVERIQELEKEYGKLNWRVALQISEEIAQEKFCKFQDKKQAMEVAIRVGIAYVTNGVVSSPLEGFTDLKIKKRRETIAIIWALFRYFIKTMLNSPARNAPPASQE